MTGYASVQCAAPNSAGTTIGIELRAVNSRFLDITFKMPDEWRAVELPMRQLLGRHVQRGKLELRGFCRLDQGPRAPDSAQLQQLLLLQLTEQALTQLQSARLAEGQRLAEVIGQHMAQLHTLATQAEQEMPQALQAQRQRWEQRMAEALAQAGTEGASVGQERVLAEATAYAIKVDVAEELNRLNAHLQAMQEAVQRPGGHGKRLDFLVQELHREANTLGSKAANLALSRVAMEMKIVIEQIREQVQNIE